MNIFPMSWHCKKSKQACTKWTFSSNQNVICSWYDISCN
jgi:hypothetical protein